MREENNKTEIKIEFSRKDKLNQEFFNLLHELLKKEPTWKKLLLKVINPELIDKLQTVYFLGTMPAMLAKPILFLTQPYPWTFFGFNLLDVFMLIGGFNKLNKQEKSPQKILTGMLMFLAFLTNCAASVFSFAKIDALIIKHGAASATVFTHIAGPALFAASMAVGIMINLIGLVQIQRQISANRQLNYLDPCKALTIQRNTTIVNILSLSAMSASIIPLFKWGITAGVGKALGIKCLLILTAGLATHPIGWGLLGVVVGAMLLRTAYTIYQKKKARDLMRKTVQEVLMDEFTEKMSTATNSTSKILPKDKKQEPQEPIVTDPVSTPIISRDLSTSNESEALNSSSDVFPNKNNSENVIKASPSDINDLYHVGENCLKPLYDVLGLKNLKNTPSPKEVLDAYNERIKELVKKESVEGRDNLNDKKIRNEIKQIHEIPAQKTNFDANIEKIKRAKDILINKKMCDHYKMMRMIWSHAVRSKESIFEELKIESGSSYKVFKSKFNETRKKEISSGRSNKNKAGGSGSENSNDRLNRSDDVEILPGADSDKGSLNFMEILASSEYYFEKYKSLVNALKERGKTEKLELPVVDSDSNKTQGDERLGKYYKSFSQLFKNSYTSTCQNGSLQVTKRFFISTSAA